MARKKKLWFHPKKVTKWKKSQPATTRRRMVYAATDKRKSKHDRSVEAARTIGALCNVTKDPSTKIKACADANYFYKKAKKIKK